VESKKVESTEDNKQRRLLKRAVQHDEAALSELFNAHTQRLLDSIRSELGDKLRQRLESRDVMQQVYLDALNNIDSFVDRGHDSFYAWLRRIALNRICDVDRRQFRTTKRAGEIRTSDLERNASALLLFDRLIGSGTSPSMAADFTDRIRLLQGALDRLTGDQRDAIRYRYLNQLDVPETAARMNRSEGAVRSLCVRALIRLRELLEDVI